MQASLALIGFVLGTAAWWVVDDWRWLAGAVLLLAAWPYTLLLIMPTNTALKKLSLAEAGPASRALLARWGRLHARAHRARRPGNGTLSWRRRRRLTPSAACSP